MPRDVTNYVANHKLCETYLGIFVVNTISTIKKQTQSTSKTVFWFTLRFKPQRRFKNGEECLLGAGDLLFELRDAQVVLAQFANIGDWWKHNVEF